MGHEPNDHRRSLSGCADWPGRWGPHRWADPSLCSGLKTATTRSIVEDLLNEVERLATLRNAEVIVAAMQAELAAREVHYLMAPQFSRPGAGLRLTA
jgi:hypothetical protein